MEKFIVSFFIFVVTTTLTGVAQGEYSFKQGVKKFYARDYIGAIRLFTIAIDSNPNYLQAYNSRAMAYRNMKQYEKALADYSKMILLAPKDTMAFFNRGITYGFMEDYESAARDYSIFIQLDPKNPRAYLARGNVYLIMKQYDLAIRDFEDAAKINPKMALCYRFLGQAKCESGDTLAGCAEFAKANEMGLKAVQSLIDQYCTGKADDAQKKE